MKTNFLGLGLVLLASLGSVGCMLDDTPSNRYGGTGVGSSGDDPGNGDGTDPNNTKPELSCTEAPAGRSYTLFDGSKLEASRSKENVGVNRARQKPYAVLAGEYKRVLGVVPTSLASAAGSFADPPARWYSEIEHSGVSLNAIFSLSFEGCLAYTKTPAAYAANPTAETAAAECTTFMRKAWSRSPSPEEVASCVDLATTKLGTETNPRRRWTYVCASVLSSSQFLTF